jgi:outer membrane protein assembly factor BamB
MTKLISTILFLLMLNPLVYSQEIVQWRGPGRDGKYPETGLLKTWPADGPRLLWHFDELGEGHASAVVTVDRVYTAGTLEGTGYIFCLSMDGKLIWKVPYGEEWIESWPGTRSTPLLCDGRLYMLTGMGRLFSMEAANGKQLWAVDLFSDYDGLNCKWGVTENLLIDGNMLFCTPGGVKNNVIALDRNTGKLIWSCPGKGEVSAYCSPMIIKLPKRGVLITQTASSILGIDASDGTLLWSHPQPNKWSVHANTPYFQDGYLYCMSGYGQGGVMLKIAYDGSAKQEVWRNPSPDNKMGGFVVAGNVIYGSGDMKKAWYGIDWNTGNTLFTDETLMGKGVIIYADGMLYCYSDEGEVALVKPGAAGLQKAGSFQVPFGEAQHWAHPVIAGGRLYVRHGSSLMVYEIKQ